MIEEILSILYALKSKVKSFESAVKEDELVKKIEAVEKLSMEDPDFWSKKESKHILKEQSAYKKFLESWDDLKTALEDAEVLEELYREGESEVEDDLRDACSILSSKTEAF